MKIYSPKIKEDLIPKLYRIAKKKGVPMTELVDGIIREALETEYQADRKGADGNGQCDPCASCRICHRYNEEQDGKNVCGRIDRYPIRKNT